MVLAVFSVCSVLSTPALAAKSLSELKKEMSERQEQMKEAEKKIKAKEQEKDAQVEKRIELDVQISALEEDIDATNAVISEKDKEIAEKGAQIEQLQTEIDNNKETLQERLRITYEYGGLSYIEILLKADGFGDLLTKIALLKDIVTHDQEVINKFIADQTAIAEAKKVVETERSELVGARDILEDKQSDLKVLQAERQAIIDSLNADIAALEKEEKAAEAEYNSIMAQVKKAQQSNSSSGTVVTKGTGQFVWPSTASTRVTSSYGKREKPNAAATSMHRGIDIGAPSGTDVVAADSGTVIVAGYGRSYGNYIVIDHGNGYTTLYAHNSRLCVSVGASVSRGQVIAKCGSTGNSTGPHIHFEISKNGTLVNPMNFF